MTINDEALKGRPKNPRKKNPKNHYGKIAWRIFRFFISPFQGCTFSYALFTQGGATPFGNRFPWAPLRSRRWRFATRYAFAGMTAKIGNTYQRMRFYSSIKQIILYCLSFSVQSF
jgi:hypothetical protein